LNKQNTAQKFFKSAFFGYLVLAAGPVMIVHGVIKLRKEE